MSRPSRSTDAQQARARELRRAGWSVGRIARDLGLPIGVTMAAVYAPRPFGPARVRARRAA